MKSNHTWNIEAAIEKAAERKESPTKYVLEQQKYRTRQDLLKLRLAVQVAESVMKFDRELLHDIYRDMVTDPDLWSQWESRRMKTKEKPFKIVSASGEEEDKEATKLLEAGWFFDFIDAALDSKAWGFSLIEFGDLINGKFMPYSVVTSNSTLRYYPAVNVIDRDNVKPEFGIITNTPGQVTGKAFDDKEFQDHLMFIGGCEHGWLFKAAKYNLIKNNAVENWSEWAEVFGMDKRIGFTDSDGDARKNFMRAMRDLGSNAYGVFGSRDKVEYLGTNRADAYLVYKELIDKLDTSIAKLIFGQDVIANNIGHVKGEAGSDVANMYGAADARFITGIVNDQLLPTMEKLGFTGFKGKKFMFDNTEKLTLKDRVVVDKTIHDMGKTHSDEYVNSTYGTDVVEKVEEKPEPIVPPKGKPVPPKKKPTGK